MQSRLYGGVLLALSVCLLVFLSFPVYAGLDVTLDKDTVFLGDTLTYQGTLSESYDFDGTMTTKLICDNTDLTLAQQKLSLIANQEFAFSRQIILSVSSPGKCHLEFTLLENQTKKERYKSDDFTITTELNAVFASTKQRLQLGETMHITGIVLKGETPIVAGLATLTFRQKDDIILIDTTPIINGKFDYLFDSKNKLAGSYIVDIKVNDIYQNHNEFDPALAITLTDVLTVYASTDKQEYVPGEAIRIKGGVQSELGNIMDGTIASISFVDLGKDIPLTTGSFELALQIPTDMKSGRHELEVVVKDALGNRGSQQLILTVLQKPTRIETLLSTEAPLKPLEQLGVTARPLDQADDVISGTAKITLTDHKKKVLMEAEVGVDQQTQLIIPEQTPAGEYTLTVESATLKDTKTIIVDEQRALNLALLNSTLIFENVGNIVYDPQLEITLTSVLRNYTLLKQPRIGLKGTYKLDLSKSVMSGTYDTKVRYPSDLFSNISDEAATTPSNIEWVDGSIVFVSYNGVTLVDDRNIMTKALDALRLGFENLYSYLGSPAKAILAIVVLIIIVVFIIERFLGNPAHAIRRRHHKASSVRRQQKLNKDFGKWLDKDDEDE